MARDGVLSRLHGSLVSVPLRPSFFCSVQAGIISEASARRAASARRRHVALAAHGVVGPVPEPRVGRLRTTPSQTAAFAVPVGAEWQKPQERQKHRRPPPTCCHPTRPGLPADDDRLKPAREKVPIAQLPRIERLDLRKEHRGRRLYRLYAVVSFGLPEAEIPLHQHLHRRWAWRGFHRHLHHPQTPRPALHQVERDEHQSPEPARLCAAARAEALRCKIRSDDCHRDQARARSSTDSRWP